MALHLDPGDHRPLQREQKVRPSDIAHEWRVSRDGIEVIAHGALICPACDAPLAVIEPIPAGASIECGFCSHRDRARTFLVRDVYDTVANEAYMVAKLV